MIVVSESEHASEFNVRLIPAVVYWSRVSQQTGCPGRQLVVCSQIKLWAAKKDSKQKFKSPQIIINVAS